MEDKKLDFKQISGDTWCLRATVNIPVYFLTENKVVLIDSGHKDERTRPALDRMIEEYGLTVRAVIGSHSHYDHLGNHIYLQERFGAEVIIPEIEAALIKNYMMFAPVYGQYVERELSTILPEMMITPDRIISQDDHAFEIDGVEFMAIDLKGHTPGQMGFITPDDVFYVADALMGERELAVSKLPTTLDWTEDFKTKEKLLASKHKKYILAHGDIYDDISELVKLNIDDKKERIEKTLELLKTKDVWTLESFQQDLWDALGVKTKNPFNRRVFTRNATYLLNYLVEIEKLESFPEEGIINYRVV